MANSDRRQRAASTSAEPLTTPRRPDEQSRCRTHRRHLTEARRAPGASRASRLASAPPVAKAKGTDAKRASRDALYPGDFIPESRAKSSRNAERHQIGMVREIIPESRATSVGIRRPWAEGSEGNASRGIEWLEARWTSFRDRQLGADYVFQLAAHKFGCKEAQDAISDNRLEEAFGGRPLEGPVTTDAQEGGQ